MPAPKVDTCSVTTDGTCAMHGVEIERRKSDGKRLDRIEKHMDELIEFMSTLKALDLGRNIGMLLTFMNRMLGLSVLGILFITGSYVYTYVHTVSADMYLERNVSSQRIMEDKLSEFRVQQAIIKTNYQAMVEKLDETNLQLAKLIVLMDRHRETEPERGDYRVPK